MADYKSQQQLQVAPPNYSPLKPNELGGRLRVAWWEFNTTDDPTSTMVEDDEVILAVIPKGARILGIEWACEAGGANQVVDVGIRGNDGTGYYDEAGTLADDDNFFTIDGAVDIHAAGDPGLAANTLTNNYGYVTDKEVQITMKFFDDTGSTAVAADKDVNGHITYVVD